MCLTLEYCNGFDTSFNLFHVRIVLMSFNLFHVRIVLTSFKSRLKLKLTSFKSHLKLKLISFKSHLKLKLTSFKSRLKLKLTSFKSRLKLKLTYRFNIILNQFLISVLILCRLRFKICFKLSLRLIFFCFHF